MFRYSEIIYYSRVQEWLVLGLSLFLIYINDLSGIITSICKIFTDNTSLFSKVLNINKSATEPPGRSIKNAV